MDINSHPIWKSVSPVKKPFHLFRIFMAKRLASLYPRSSFIGITGSVGKTSTVRACEAVLSQKFKTISTIENLDPVINIPITLLRLKSRSTRVILEMGIEYLGEMDFYLSMVAPATAIIIRIAYQHSEFLGDIEEIAAEKGKLIKSLPKTGFAILNWDDIRVRKMANETGAEVIFFGTNQENCHVWAGNIRIENLQTCFELNCGVERVEVRLQLLGKHFITSALAAAALGISQGMSLIVIKKGLENLQPVDHRLKILEGIGNWTVIDDTYNASPVSVEEALNLVSELPARRRILVMGEMRELGIYTEKLHRQLAQKIFKDKLDVVLLTGGETHIVADELIKLGFPADKIELNLSHSQIVAMILKNSRLGDLILVKGARAVKLEEVVRRITKKEDD